MKVRLEHGKRYRAIVNASVGSSLGMGILYAKLTSVGFRDIKVTSLKDGVEVLGTYTGKTLEIELEQQVKVIQQVA